MSLEIMYFAHGTTYGNAQSKLIKEKKIWNLI